MVNVQIYNIEKDNWSKGAGLAQARRRAAAGAAEYQERFISLQAFSMGIRAERPICSTPMTQKMINGRNCRMHHISEIIVLPPWLAINYMLRVVKYQLS
jgi:hypothetical protein